MKVGLDYCFTLVMWVLEKMDKVSAELASTLVEVIIKKEIGPIQEAALKKISPYINSLIQSLPYIGGYVPKI